MALTRVTPEWQMAFDKFHIKDLFKVDKKPENGLIPLEWAVLIYLAFTIMLMGFMSSRIHDFDVMITFRIRVVVLMTIMWGVYRLAPCRATMILRVVVQMAMLADWYPDTYEFNRCFINLDYLFAGWEHSVFHCQPSLLFSQKLPWGIVSEPLCLGYFSYYPIIGVTAFFYAFYRPQDFQKCVFVIMAAFFICYVVYIFLPVTGPTFYFKAVGVDKILEGTYPALGHYFEYHQDLTGDCLVTPGWQKGLFWNLVEMAKGVGERPTAAFPSSHVGITTVCMCLLWQSGNRKVFLRTLPFAILLFFATFYIQAHYCIDAIAGLITGVILYFVLVLIYPKLFSR